MPAPSPDLSLHGAQAALARGDFALARTVCERLVKRNARDVAARYCLGLAFALAGENAAAIQQWRQVLKLQPRDLATLINLAVALSRQGQHREAVPLLRSASTLDGKIAAVHFNLGNSLLALGQLDEAVDSLQRSIRLDARLAAAHNSLGAVYRRQGRLPEAVAAFSAAIASDNQNVEAHGNLGLALLESGGTSERALGHLRRASQLEPANVEAAVSLGVALLRAGNFAGALASVQSALVLQPDLPTLWRSSGQALEGLGQLNEALASYRRALVLAPADSATLASAVSCAARCCDWPLLSECLQRLRELPGGLEALHPFVSLSLCEDPAEQLRIARAHVACGPASVGARSLSGPASARIRIGYLSSDLRDHAVAHLLIGALERHDRERFEIHALALRNHAGNTAIDARLRRAVAGYHELGGSSDAEAIERIRALGLDIAVDLNGHTAGGRPALLAARVAPVQAAYLGYAGTSGLAGMDYLIADSVVIPAAETPGYSEQLVRLPHCYLPNDDRRELQPSMQRLQAGLPDEAFVFCAFTQPYKIGARIFEVWMRLLVAVPGSVLWLKQMAACPQRNLQQVAARHGIEGERLIFAPHMAHMAEHLGRQILADLYLDTSPYGAHSSACDALWAGLPVLTCAGRTFASRVAASALLAAGLPELVTHELCDYEQRALHLARDPAHLAALRSQLAQVRTRSTLFDTARYTRDLESAFTTMHARSRAGLAPTAFEVQ